MHTERSVVDEVSDLRDEERALMVAVGRGDRAAFRRLHDRFRPLVERWVLHQLPDRAQAEEVVQDVFLEVWLVAERFDPRHTAVAWLRTIAQRRAIDRVRKAVADRDRDLRVGSREHQAEDVAGVEGAEMVLDVLALRRAIHALPERQREAVVLRHLVGLSGPELGARLGVPTGTAKTRARDGVATLRRTLTGPQPVRRRA